MVDTRLLAGEIAKNKETYRSCAKALGMTPNTFTRIMNGSRDLTLKEANTLVKFLNIENVDDMVKIFFYDFVRD